MLPTKRLFKNPHRPLEERLGLADFPLRLVTHGQIVECHGHVWVVPTEELLFDSQGALVEPLSFGGLALLVFNRREIVEVHRQFVMPRTVNASESGMKSL